MENTTSLITELNSEKIHATQLRKIVTLYNKSVLNVYNTLTYSTEVNDIIRTINNDLLELNNISSAISILPGANVVSESINSFTSVAMDIIKPIKKSSDAFEIVINPIRTKLHDLDQLLDTTAVKLEKSGLAAQDTVNIIMVSKKCMDKHSAEKSQIKFDTICKLQIIAVSNTNVVLNTLISSTKELDLLLKGIRTDLSALTEIKRELTSIAKVISSAQKIINPINALLSKNITVPYGTQVKVKVKYKEKKSKWYKAAFVWKWKWETKTKWKNYTFTVQEIFNKLSVIAAIEQTLKNAAMKAIKPVLTSVNIPEPAFELSALATMSKKLYSIRNNASAAIISFDSIIEKTSTLVNDIETVKSNVSIAKFDC